MKSFITPLGDLKDFEQIQSSLKLGKTPVYVDGCLDSQKSHLMSSLSEDYRFKIIVTYSEAKVKEIYQDYKFFDRGIFVYPAKDVIFYNADVHGNLIIKQRLEIIRRLLEGVPTTIITTLDGLMDEVMPLEKIRNHMIALKIGDILDLEDFKKKMLNMGFERVGQIEGPGQFTIRGGIIDVYNIAQDCPYRIELWDDEVNSIRSFDVESQRSIENIEEFKVYPASEMIFDTKVMENGIKKIEADKNKYVKNFIKNKQPEAAKRLEVLVEELTTSMGIYYGDRNIDSFIRYFYDDETTFLDYFSNEDSIVFWDEPNRLAERGDGVWMEFEESMKSRLEKGYILPGQMKVFRTPKEVLAKGNQMNSVLLSTLEQREKAFDIQNHFHMNVKSINSYNSSFELLMKDLEVWNKNKYRMILVSNSKTRAGRLAKDLQSYGFNAFETEDMDREVMAGEIMVCHGNLHRGMEYPLIKFVIISESDIFGEEKKKRKPKKEFSGEKIQGFSDLNIGDYVVHENHGLGIYKGIEKVSVDGVEKDYIKIEYAGGGNLYILATQLNLIQKYASADARAPKLNKLGNADWSKTKARVRGAVKDLAADLIKLYAKRQAEQGYAFEPDTVWQTEFEEIFPYEETQDQLRAIEATKRDMESTKIMDRLICGDVGYGKTEIAIRAAFKAVQDGKQVVLLVPTTILAQQHYHTFVQRMKDYPITVGTLSRFRSKAEQSLTLKELKKGAVDILVGTHRVLSKDVQFKNLGLLIVDEEQRFGVSHKEKIKNLRENIDVLTLSATPIPRTLHMSLIGIRDMSVLTEPPMDRMPIQTYVMEFNEELIREAIHREAARGGQVYYVFNRVNGIAEMAAVIQKMVPDLVVSYAHGQMNERQLEKIMYQFINGEIDVLVSTTIIETGLDISNVNTMIIHDADKFGLSQLYQLRGRVGRSSRTAYAFLLYQRNKIIREEAQKRLSAIREFTELGAGFKIAMRDLEIRGAGNLLGQQQSGHMESVGYDLYCKMLNEAVRKLKGETTVEDEFETTIDVDVDAFIPASYIRNEFQKLEIYKRIAAIENEDEYSEMMDELLDRFGDLPRAAQNLLDIALLKAMAHDACMTELVHRDNVTRITLYDQAPVDIRRLPVLINKYGKAIEYFPKEKPHFLLKIKEKNKFLLKCEKSVIKDIKALLDK